MDIDSEHLGIPVSILVWNFSTDIKEIMNACKMTVTLAVCKYLYVFL